MSNSGRPHRRQLIQLPRPWDSLGKNTGVGCHFLLQCMKVKSESEFAQFCPTLSNPMDYSQPGSSTHEIFQARVLEWGSIAFSGTETEINWNRSILLFTFLKFIEIPFCYFGLIPFFFFIHSFFRISGGKGNESLPWKGNRHLSRKASIFIFKEK